MKRILEPSGDHWADLSWAFEELVRLRVGPFSIGAVKTSPRATNRARSPLGLRLKFSICSAAETCAGLIATPSLGTSMEMWRDWLVEVSRTFSSPSISY